MRKSICVWAFFAALPLLGMAQQKSAPSTDKVMKAIEQTWQTTAHKSALHQDATFQQNLKTIMERADASSIDLVNNYGDVIYMSGLLADVETLIKKLPATLKTTEAGRQMVNGFYAMRSMKEGERVPDFTLKTPEGKEVNFYQFIQGKKCVILDFWASWCGWCRKESPNVMKAYEEFKGADFDVISVSFDNKRDRWVKAIEEDKTPWTQVSDLLGCDKSDLYKWYDLNGIPAILLVDGNGKVLKLRMRGEQIYNSVKEVLGK